jgi:hypothetical protein
MSLPSQVPWFFHHNNIHSRVLYIIFWIPFCSSFRVSPTVLMAIRSENMGRTVHILNTRRGGGERKTNIRRKPRRETITGVDLGRKLKCIFKTQITNINFLVRFEVLTAVSMKNVVFWDVAPCRSCVNWSFGGKYRLHLQGRKLRERGTNVSRRLQTELSTTPVRFT